MDAPVQPAGLSVASAPVEFCSSTLLFVKDILSDREFLVDSGASVSVFPDPRSSSVDGVGKLWSPRMGRNPGAGRNQVHLKRFTKIVGEEIHC